ncbi:hypothetical protein MRB53_036935 [Persea americana]|nr:hypothetical protein MRB53_036935 [Persea americana]
MPYRQYTLSHCTLFCIIQRNDGLKSKRHQPLLARGYCARIAPICSAVLYIRQCLNRPRAVCGPGSSTPWQSVISLPSVVYTVYSNKSCPRVPSTHLVLPRARWSGA